MTAIPDMQLSTLTAVIPEIYLCITVIAYLMFGVFSASDCPCRTSPRSGVMVLGGALFLVLTGNTDVTHAMNGMFLSNGFTVFAKALVLIAGILALMLSADWLKDKPFEYVALVLFSILGMMLMISANDFLALYMGLEMSSLALYVLASFDRDSTRSTEAGLKYFVLGALASGMVLFGISLVYGFTGTTGFGSLSATLASGEIGKAVIVGMILIIVGLCFKVSAVPFHMWAPDVYEGAPTPVTAFFATAPKIAALALFARVMLEPFGGVIASWQPVLILVSMASMLGGALAAMMQTNIKRLLAYSSISHAGFILMGLASGNQAGLKAMLIYLALYIFMSAGVFGCVLLMRRGGQAVEGIKDLSGLSQQQPLLAGLIAVFFFSMAGIPPLAGFFGKFYVILASIEAGLYALAAVAVLASVVGCYYYIKVVKIMYFDDPAPGFDRESSFTLRTAIAIGAVVTLWFFIIPSPLVSSAARAAEAMLK